LLAITRLHRPPSGLRAPLRTSPTARLCEPLQPALLIGSAGCGAQVDAG